MDYSLLQAVVVGYFNFTRLDKTPGYKEFYKAAIRVLEGDPSRELIFAVVTNAVSSEKDFNIHEFPSASIVTWSNSLVSKRTHFSICSMGNTLDI